MTPRERYKAMMNFEKPDKIPWAEMIDVEPLLQWVYEGKIDPRVIRSRPGYQFPEGGMISADNPRLLDFPINLMFGCIDFMGLIFPNDKGIIPRFTIKQIADTDDYYEIRGDSGVHVRRTKHAPHKWYSMPMFTHWPVKDKRSWEEYKKRLDPKDNRRIPMDWDQDEYAELFKNYQAGPTKVTFNGLYGFGAQLMGISKWNTLFFEDPDLADDIADFWEYFTIELYRPFLNSLGEYVDTTSWFEDFAEKHGPFVSRKTFERFFLPHYKKVARFFKEKGIKHAMLDSDGNINSLLDLLIEAGIDGIWPMEVNAGMDAATVRERFGKKIWFDGNIDKREACLGGERMKKEVDRKMAVAEEGGYALGVDHVVHTEFTYEKFVEYANYMKEKLSY